MCEILLCVTPRGTTGKLALDCKRPQAGDVVAVRPDGYGWGKGELGQIASGEPGDINHSFFRVIKLPNITADQISNLMTPEIGTAGTTLNPIDYLQFRGFYLNISAIGPSVTYLPLINYWNDNARAQPFLQSAITFAQLQPLITQRPAITAAQIAAAV